MRAGLFACLTVAACAAAKPGVPGGDASSTIDTPMITADACPPDQLATNVTASGQVTCVPIDGLTQQALAEHCSAYLGWRDSCDGCTTGPAKWGRAGTTACSPGVGTNNTCTMPALGGSTVHLFGLDFDGDVDGNDKLYGGLHCTADASGGNGVGPCPTGQLVDGFNGTAWTCSTFAKFVTAWVGTNCSLYMGWQDGCDGCLSPPPKWGLTSEAACMNGAGTDNTCIAPLALGTETVRLFGLNPDGDVDGNDKLHVGLRCDPAMPSSSTQMATCPAGHFVTATVPGGFFRCESAAPFVERYFAEHCTLYFGWRDGCDGCVTPPAKWGKVRAQAGSCANGIGADSTCSTFTLGQSVEMFGLNTDGDVDGNDALYVGFRCE